MREVRTIDPAGGRWRSVSGYGRWSR